MQQQDQAILESLKDTVREMESFIREEYCTDYDDFLENDILKRAIAMCLISSDQMISRLSDDFITAHQRIIFARFTTIRYIAERSYRSLDFYALWIAATEELPAFLNELFLAAGMDPPTKRLGQVQTQSPLRQEPVRSQMPQEPSWAREEPRPQAQPQMSPQTHRYAQMEERTVMPESRTYAHMDDQPAVSEPRGQEARQPFVMNELYKRQAYNQMMQKNMTKEESAIETKKEVNMLLDMLEKEKQSRGL